MTWVKPDKRTARAALRHHRTPDAQDLTEAVAADEAEHRDLLTQEQLDRAAERADCAIYDLRPGLLGYCKPTNTTGRPGSADGLPEHEGDTLHALPQV